MSEIGTSYVVVDGNYAHRWYDAGGPAINKVLEEFIQTPYTAASTIGSWTTTLVGASTHALVAGALGGQMVITTAGADNDGAQLQALGEAFLPTNATKIYFGISLAISEATQSDFLVGLTITDTTAIGGVSDGIYFKKIDGATLCNFCVESAGDVTTNPAFTVAAATTYILEWTWDGHDLLYYVDGVEIGSSVLTNIPTVEYMTPTIAFLTGDNAAITMCVDWIRCIQIPVG